MVQICLISFYFEMIKKATLLRSFTGKKSINLKFDQNIYLIKFRMD